jgi:fatty-acid desaturase
MPLAALVGHSERTLRPMPNGEHLVLRTPWTVVLVNVVPVVVLLFVAFLTGFQIGTAVALLFIAAMICTALGFAIFLHETRLGTRAVRVRTHILEHEPDEE